LELFNPVTSAPTPLQSACDAASDEVERVVTQIYRRFNDWSKRGFGPDDVTWCEVKANIIELVTAMPRAPQESVNAQMLEALEKIVAATQNLCDNWYPDVDQETARSAAKEEIETARAAIAAAEAAPKDEWQPIESAPRDGTRFLAFAHQVDSFGECDFIGTCEWKGALVEGGWSFGFPASPTNWCPFPAPPSQPEPGR
jgi:hypothetical protein